MEYKYKDNKIIFKNKNDFNPKHIFECGQAFRWKKEQDNSYTTVAFNRVLNVLLEDDFVVLNNTSEEDFNNIWIDYFDLNTDYNDIKEKLSKEETLKNAMEFGYGIRILNQEKFETIISFIISANNQIPRIKKSIEILANNYGEFIDNFRGVDYFSFPTSTQLSKVSAEELREVARVGFRDKRIHDVAKLINDGDFNINDISKLSSEELQKKLMILPGVGPKVASCIMLFSYGRSETFPIDVWIKRVMEELYIKKETNIKLIGKYADEIFGDLAGYAQQYLFYYGRENDIGKSK
ncbi:DNA-3-methyladenine glycosylase family protein [Miniphocaeibacter massiliensis]|uniref:DNA-3-methyladenine glycosylase family protein n=1 Tax=Miniphocaeibacter massiliensis TaxID=2041841 RepID=UPI000C08136E|nr:DNA glycosylase [Miniphocaeibacter massiliensis]